MMNDNYFSNIMIIKNLYRILILFSFVYFESCTPQNPSERMMELLVQYIDVLKSTHINSQRDIDELKDKIDALNEKKEDVKIMEEQMMKKMSQEEINDYSLDMMEKMERSGIMEISEQESDRIKKEAEVAGVIIDFPL